MISRKERNRQAAAKSRANRRAYYDSLEAEVGVLRQRIQLLETENGMLRVELFSVSMNVHSEPVLCSEWTIPTS